MNKLYKIFCLCGVLLIAPHYTFSQVLIGSGGGEADRDAILELESGGNKGLLLPRLDLTDVNDSAPMSEHKAGMVIYNLGTTIPAGYYFNDGNQWVMITDTKIASWNKIGTNEGATGNTENIYQTGGIAVGTADLDLHTKFSVNSDNKGFLMPRLTNQEIYTLTQTAPVGAPDGLMVYNLSTKCVNYYEGGAQKWVSLCREESPSSMSVEPCSFGCGPFPATEGAYTAYVPLTSAHYYRVQIRVNVPGPYSVRVDTDNGYTFEQSGTFTEPGIYTLDLAGQGIPQRKSEPGDEALIFLNGENVTASLPYPLPKIPVAAGALSYEVNCSNSVAGNPVGEYTAKQLVQATTHYVDISVNVLASGKAIIETDEVNGLIFRSDEIELNMDDSPATVRLYAYGTPQLTGDYSYTISNASCPFNLEVITKLGEFGFPAKNCLEIYEAGVRIDGEYWVKQSASSAQAVKTYCDMTNGGYTLVWSFSEKTYRDSIPSSTTGMSMHNIETNSWGLQRDRPQNQVTLESQEINYYNYRLSTDAMKGIAEVGDKSNSLYRFRIAYDPKDMDDVWGKENYFVIDFAGSSTATIRNQDFLRTTTTAGAAYDFTGPKVEGKVFNIQWSKNGTNGRTTFNNIQRSSDSGAFYYSINCIYGHHWDYGGVPVSSSTSVTTTITKEDRSTLEITFNPAWINNFWGNVNGELNMNHHIGKCTNSADDYSFERSGGGAQVSTCTPANQYPHSFNPVYNSGSPGMVDYYHGRVFQWWVK